MDTIVSSATVPGILAIQVWGDEKTNIVSKVITKKRGSKTTEVFYKMKRITIDSVEKTDIIKGSDGNQVDDIQLSYTLER